MELAKTDQMPPASHEDDADARTDSEEQQEKPTIVKAHPIGNEKGTPLAKVMRARGGVSTWSILSGILVSFGAFVVLHALVGAVLAGTGVTEGILTPDEVAAAGVGAVIGLVVIQFLAYFWGGYTAGRMARGSGWLNGALVAVGAIVLVAAVGAAVAGLAGVDLETAFGSTIGPLSPADVNETVTAVGLALIGSMLVGGLIGGRMGARWHTKLENSQLPTPLR